jgi:lysophospholipase L1-like esterase
MRILMLMCVLVGACDRTSEDFPAGDDDAPAPDASHAQDGSPDGSLADAAPGTPDASPGTPDASPDPDAAPPFRRLLIYGDSIMNGRVVSSPELACVEVLRGLYPGEIVNDSANGRPLYLVAGTPARRAALVATVLAVQPTHLYLALGINDFVLAGDDRTSLTDYEISMANLLDALHAAMPELHIYVQSPILYLGMDPNAVGETVQGYRDACAAAVSGRDFAEHIDGLPLVPVEGISADLVHPNDIGHPILGNGMAARVTP